MLTQPKTLPSLEDDLKELLVSCLMLDLKANAIDADQPLFGDGLGLDSVDALEFGMALSKRYGIEIKSEDPEIRSAFASIRALASFIEKHRKESP